MPANVPGLHAVWQVLHQGKHFFVAGHINPDGDSIGCTLTVCSLLARMGKTSYAYAAPSIGADLQFLPGLPNIHVGQLPEKPTFDTVIMLECSDRKRGGDVEEILQHAQTIVHIDHHAVSDPYGHVNYIDAKASSTAEIIFQLFEESDGEFLPTPDEATCLYTGVATDTGRFVHSNTTPEALRVAAALAALGADIPAVNQHIYFTKPYVELKLLGRALEKMTLRFEKRYSEILLTKQDFDAFSAVPANAQGIVSMPTLIPGVEVSALFKEEPQHIAINLRSRGAVDVSKIAQQFGGGGHARAAGCKITGKTMQEAADELARALEHAFLHTH